MRTISSSKRTVQSPSVPRSSFLRSLKPAGSTLVAKREGNAVVVSVRTDGSADADIRYHWYVDGVYQATTRSSSRTFFLSEGEQARVDVIDVPGYDFDPYANAPIGYPLAQTIAWCRSLSEDVSSYKIEQQVFGGDWTTIGSVPHVDGSWYYKMVARGLGGSSGIGTYRWRVTAIDRAGNEAGTVGSLDYSVIVGRPDAPAWTMTFDSGTARVTIAEE